MYGFQSDEKIAPSQVLQKITQEEIFAFILQRPVDLADRYISPFREDTSPGCRFEQRPDGVLMFVDFGDTKGRKHRNCFMMVMDKYDVTRDAAIDIILSKFNLSKTPQDYLPPLIEYKEEVEESPKIITFDKIEYQKRDILFWAKFMINKQQLLEDNVYATNRFHITKNGKKRSIGVFSHCYAMDFISRVKIYQPNSEKYRWITNCNENNIGNIDNLPATGDVLFIKKSYKDHRVIRNLGLGLNVIWFQNEGSVPDIPILKNLVDRFKLIVIFYDNDEPGVIAALKLVNIFNSLREGSCKMIHLPIYVNRQRQWKDPAQFISKEGRKDLLTMFYQLLDWQDIKL